LKGETGTRRIEPYSLRQTLGGDIILHAFNTEKNDHRSYRIERITGARVTNQIFIPRYEVELTPHGPLSVPSTQQSFQGRSASIFSVPSRSTYVFECPSCGKKFRRKKYDSKLNSHTDKNGFPCYGRFGTLVDTLH